MLFIFQGGHLAFLCFSFYYLSIPPHPVFMYAQVHVCDMCARVETSSGIRRRCPACFGDSLSLAWVLLRIQTGWPVNPTGLPVSASPMLDYKHHPSFITRVPGIELRHLVHDKHFSDPAISSTLPSSFVFIH